LHVVFELTGVFVYGDATGDIPRGYAFKFKEHGKFISCHYRLPAVLDSKLKERSYRVN